MSLLGKKAGTGSPVRSGIFLAVLTLPLVLSACTSTKQVLSHGYQMNEDTLSLVSEGSSREQVLLALGSPSTTQGSVGGSETFYYISQKKARAVAFLRPTLIDQRVLAVYLNDGSTVDRIANYGLKDGRVFDFVARVTPTTGKDLSFIGQILSAKPSAAGALGGS